MGDEAGESQTKSPTPDGMGLVHVFAPPGFMSESRGSRGTGGNSKASARFHGHKTNGALGKRRPQHAVRKKPRRPRRSFAPCRKSTPFPAQILTTQIQPGGSKLIGGLCGFGCRLLLLSSPVKQEKPEPPSLPLRLPLPGQPLGFGKLHRGHEYL